MAGMSRFGAGVLTIEPNPVFVNNAAQARANLILSGVDYYSTDISELFKDLPASQTDQVYQSWLANIALLNLPLVLTSEVMNYPWAKLNLDMKASLEPYYYSLAWEASQTWDPIIAPLLYYFQDDPLARDRVIETMIGPHILVASGVTPNMERIQFYLPEGRWYDLHNRDLVQRPENAEEEASTLPAKLQGMNVAPLLAREGAIIPMILDPSGPARRKSILVFPGPEPSAFTWYDDNGTDLSFHDNFFTTTAFELVPSSETGSIELTIKAKAGAYPGEIVDHRFWVEFVGLPNVGTATLDGEEHKRPNSEDQLRELDSGWFSLGDGRLVFKTPKLDPAVDHKIVLK
jgi:alpha-glucosidase